MNMTEKDWTTVKTALSTAGTQYERDANDAVKRGDPRMAQQFRRQADEASALLDRIEQSVG